MQIKTFLQVSGIALLIYSCAGSTKDSDFNKQSDNDHLLNAVLYHQTSAEYKALCYQSFNLGRIMLNNDLLDKSIVKPRAIVVDIDETVLDNSPYEAKCIIENISYPQSWKEWVELAKAKPIPGALDFLNYVDSMGVDIMYVTNRKQDKLEATIKNLKETAFPQIDESHVFMRMDKSSKEERRNKILENYHISLLAGDNMHDFTDAFEGKSQSERSVITDSLKSEFGKRFLVLPNPMYGSWDGVFYEDYKKPSDQEKHEIRLKNLESF